MIISWISEQASARLSQQQQLSPQSRISFFSRILSRSFPCFCYVKSKRKESQDFYLHFLNFFFLLFKPTKMYSNDVLTIYLWFLYLRFKFHWFFYNSLFILYLRHAFKNNNYYVAYVIHRLIKKKKKNLSTWKVFSLSLSLFIYLYKGRLINIRIYLFIRLGVQALSIISQVTSDHHLWINAM